MSTLNPNQWQAVDAYLDQALDMTEGERAELLASLRAQNPGLAAHLEELLQEHCVLAQENFLEQGPTPPLAVPPALAGQRVGPYTLLSPIGEGGMGSVWLAQRHDGRFERRVAVKFLRAALNGRSGVERFKREGSILGRLTHPHVAQLLDAGVSLSGQPYLVLELVDGPNIVEYCDERKLDVEARVKLFCDVLGAVAEAHAHLIVHRDIKPSNVLVRKDGQVKLLDFGIAKLLAREGDTAPATMLTMEDGGALTPRFAAPEQVTGGTVTTATDVYALGVLLYLLLTGQHPAGTSVHSPADLVKAVVELEAPRASKIILEEGTAAEKHNATPAKLRRQLSGDLDTILGKALKKNPQERYASVTAFADDLQRYQKHEAISVRPDTFAYRTAKFVHRNRTAVILTGLAFMALIGGIAGTLMQARTARRQRDIAFRERDRADRIADVMTGIFKVSDPGERVGNSVTAREVLDKASKDIGTGLSKDPELQAHMAYVMGMAYLNLGLYSRAEALLGRSIRAGNSAGGGENRETLKSMQKLAWTLVLEGRFADAESQQRKLLAIEQRVLGPDDGDTVGVKGDFATTLSEEGHLAEAEKIQREVLESQKRALGPEATFTLVTMNNLAAILLQERRFPEADKLEREAIEIKLRVAGPENLSTIHYIQTEATIRMDMGELDESEKSLRQLLELERRVLAPHQPEIALTVYQLAMVAAKRGRIDDALALLGQAVDIGLRPADALQMGEDPDLNALHRDPRFAALVAKAKQRAAVQKTN